MSTVGARRRLGEVCRVQKGTTITEKQATPGPIPVVAGGTRPTYFHNTHNRSAGVVTISASGANAGYVNYWDDPIWASDCTTVEVSDPDQMVNRYLFHFLKSVEATTIASLRRGAAQPHVYAKDIQEIEIPLPPIEEQRRIASILDAADALRAKRRRTIEIVDGLARSIFIEMFGNPLNSGRGAQVRTSETALGDLARIRTGKLDANAASEDGPYPFFTCAEETLRIDTPAFDSKATLVAGNGTLNVKYYEGEFNAYQRTYVINSLDESLAHPKFLHGFLDIYVGRLRQQAIGGVIKYIKLGMLTEAKVSLPSIEDQRTFVRRIEAVSESLLSIVESMERLESLHSSLLHCAFAGEL